MKRLLLAFLLLTAVTYTRAQDAELDSLLKNLKTAPDDTNKVNTLIAISSKYRNSSADSAIYFAEQAKTEAEKIYFPKGIGYALKALGLAFNQKGDYVNALQKWKQALGIFEKYSIKTGESNMLNNIGAVYYAKGDENNALDNYLKSLKIAEEIHDTLRIGTALANIAGVYSNKPATYQKSLDYHRKALFFSIASGNSELIGNSYANIGEIFISMQKEDSGNMKLLDSALLYLKQGQVYLANTYNEAYVINAMGKVYRLKKENVHALDLYQMGYSSGKTFESKLDMGQALLGSALTYQEEKDFNTAISFYKKAEALMVDIGLDESYDITKVYEGLAFSCAQMNNHVDAFNYQQKLIDTKDKIYNLEVDKKLGTKLFAFEMEKKQGEINLQEEIIGRQKLVRNGFIGGFAIMVLFAVVFFLQRNKIGREKKRSDELLLNILPEEVAEELKAKGEAEAKHIEEVTVLFTDFKGFTAIAEKLTPKELVTDIHECFSAFDHIMEKYGMEKIKTIGDSYMAAGGLPTPNKTNASDAVNAAIEIRQFIEEGKARKIAIGKPYFEIRIGIHTGPVVAGIVGVKKFAYDIWGDTVNTASRMESSGEVGKVNISGNTYALVKDKFKCIQRGKIEARGKGEIDMYFVEDRIG